MENHESIDHVEPEGGELSRREFLARTALALAWGGVAAAGGTGAASFTPAAPAAQPPWTAPGPVMPPLRYRLGRASLGRMPSEAPLPGFAPLGGGAFSGAAVAESPDPLANYRWDRIGADDPLQVYELRPVAVTADAPGSFEGLQSLTGETPAVTVRGPGSLRLDFGVESAGWLELDSPDLAGAVELSIGEYNEPAILNAGAQHPAKTLAPVRHGQTWRLELNRELYEGVRFGWIHVRSFERPWRITAARLVCQARPANYEGAFACSDPLLTRIWYTGAYAVRLNFQKTYLGAILMERSDRFSWTGDAHPSQAAALTAFAQWDFVARNLEHTSTQDNGIASYALYWILSLVEYFEATGDRATLERFLDNARGKLDRAAVRWDNPAPLGFYGWDERLGAGFERPNGAETTQAWRMLWLRAARAFARAARAAGRADLAGQYEAQAERRIAGLRRDSRWAAGLGPHAAADAVNAEFADAAERETLGRALESRLDRMSFSPFNQYFIVQALGRLGRDEQALTTVRDVWGGQVAYGATSFFEVYRPAWNGVLGPLDPVPNNQCGYTSLCHPWSSGVTAWLTRQVLGIKPAEPGYRRWSVRPHPGARLDWIEGSVRTPRGMLRARFDFAAGQARIDAPAGTAGTVAFPLLGRRAVTAALDGKTIWGGPAAVPGAAPRGIAVRIEGDWLVLENVPGGPHRIEVRLEGKHAVAGPDPLAYPLAMPVADTTTGGAWRGRYGREGWVLFNFHQAGRHETRLPDYVASVAPWRAKNGAWPVAAGDPRALEDPAGGARRLGYLRTGNPAACQQLFAVDVTLEAPRPCRVALYFADADGGAGEAKRTAVEVMNLKSLRLLAPTALVRDYGGGKYLCFEITDSVRFRIYHVRGAQAVLSGIFFDRSA